MNIGMKSRLRGFVELRRTRYEYGPAAKKAETPLIEPYRINRQKFVAALQHRHARKRVSILVVEDQRFNLQMVVEILGRGFDTHPAIDGATALKLYETHAPDMVFLDIDLPGIDGLCVLEAITALDPESFIVMLTASHDQKDVERAMQCKAQGYIVKPFTRQKINQYLSLYKETFPDRAKKQKGAGA